MAKDRPDYRFIEALIAAGKVIVEVSCNDAALVKRLLSNPIIDPQNARWLNIKGPGMPSQMWLMIDKAWER